MVFHPSFDTFASQFESGKNQVVYTRLTADLDTPVSIMMKLAQAGSNSFILESVTGGDQRGRYSIIGMDPDVIWECNGSQARINRQAQTDAAAFEPCDALPIEALRALLNESRIDLPDELPPASAGLFGYLGYDTIRLVETLPPVNPDPIGAPDAIMMRPSLIAILDAVKGDVFLISPVWGTSADPQGATAHTEYAHATARLERAKTALYEKTPQAARSLPTQMPTPVPQQAQSNFSQAAYLDAVKKAQDYIKAGDIFQVVPSQRWTQEFTEEPFALYRSLRRTNPSPYMFYFNFCDFQIIGASPEILVQTTQGKVTIRPIAGTRPRGQTAQEDLALEQDLLSDKKELAEHLMLLDLGRNDTGKVSKIGTVTPTQEFIVERYSHVMHIVSNVIGELKDDKDALDAFFAGMPAGTLSGAPKIRAMEIINELEPEKRGIYGGGCGYFSANGDMDMCITLRTAVLKDQKLYIQAGGGVVYDSVPQAEYEETVHKSNAMRKAAELSYLFSTQ